MDDSGARVEWLSSDVADTVTVELIPYLRGMAGQPLAIKVPCTEFAPGQFVFELRHRVVFGLSDMGALVPEHGR